jgi:hypothetical protein
MKRAWVIVALLAAAWYLGTRSTGVAPQAASEANPPADSRPSSGGAAAAAGEDAAPHTQAAADDDVAIAFRDHRSRVQVQGSGQVSRLLPDDDSGSRHQRFILRLPSGQTLLIAHNIDLARRVADLRVGDSVEFDGEYDWDARGGVVHWTHLDPQGRHASGWLRHDGRTFQ